MKGSPGDNVWYGRTNFVRIRSVLQGPPLTRRALDQHQRGDHPHDHSGPSSNQVHQYLSSLGAGQSGAGILEPCPDVWEDGRCISLSVMGGAKRVTFAPPEEVATSSLGGGGQSYQKVLRLLRSSNALAPLPGLGQSHGSPHWEVASHWSVGSGSTFDTRDEVAFCHGMAVLDASIASLQRSLRKDLVT
ncbi:unnamed protein product [Boreogadus saida]